MKIILLILIIGLPFLNSRNSGHSEKTICARDSVYSISDQEKDSLEAFIHKNYRDSLPGLEILVIHNDKPLYQKAFGVSHFEKQIPLKKNLIFETGSVTKLFTAVGILNLIEKGKLSLTDPLSEFYPGFPNSREIKIKHLLSHTAGIPDYAIHFMEKNIAEHFDQGFSRTNYFQDIDRQRIRKYLKNNYTRSQPGSEWEYSNGGYYLLGLIIEKVSGVSYFTYIRNNIIKPLNLKYATFRDPENTSDPKYACGHYYVNNPSKEGSRPYQAYYLPNMYAFSAGSLNSRLKDLYWFYKQVTKGKIINKKLLEKAMTPYEMKNGELANTGYGWFIHKKNGKKVICHPGCTMGFSTITHYVPEDDFFIGIYTNRHSQQCNLSSVNITLTNKVFSYFYP
ncbi:MAG: beta-lactamase family protein [Bacteroidales bacterium]|nr:beta-lactamase family protein [Bacteroidales bacterium]